MATLGISQRWTSFLSFVQNIHFFSLVFFFLSLFLFFYEGLKFTSCGGLDLLSCIYLYCPSLSLAKPIQTMTFICIGSYSLLSQFCVISYLIEYCCLAGKNCISKQCRFAVKSHPCGFLFKSFESPLYESSSFLLYISSYRGCYHPNIAYFKVMATYYG